jgi:pilus assembly protein TadC
LVFVSAAGFGLATGSLFVGLGVGIGSLLIARRAPGPDPVRLSAAELARAPLVLDLTALSLSAGHPMPAALEAGAECAGSELATLIRHAAGLLRLGAGPSESWRAVAAQPGLTALARTAVRSAESGSTLANSFQRLAGELRAERRGQAQRRAARVGVWAIAPLGLCFLPAFVCIGIAPIVIGVAGPLLGGLSP